MKKLEAAPSLSSSFSPHPSSFLRATLHRSLGRFQPKDQALCDCATCSRCYVRPLPLSRRCAPALLVVASPSRSLRSQLRSLHLRSRSFLRLQYARAASSHAHLPPPGPSTPHARPPNLSPDGVDRHLFPSCREPHSPDGSWSDDRSNFVVPQIGDPSRGFASTPRADDGPLPDGRAFPDRREF